MGHDNLYIIPRFRHGTFTVVALLSTTDKRQDFTFLPFYVAVTTKQPVD